MPPSLWLQKLQNCFFLSAALSVNLFFSRLWCAFLFNKCQIFFSFLFSFQLLARFNPTFPPASSSFLLYFSFISPFVPSPPTVHQLLIPPAFIPYLLNCVPPGVEVSLRYSRRLFEVSGAVCVHVCEQTLCCFWFGLLWRSNVLCTSSRTFVWCSFAFYVLCFCQQINQLFEQILITKTKKLQLFTFIHNTELFAF